ncbi:response regulator [Hydrogenophaga sp.]|uniref:response regulator n=1 Tax=Hydrogenophaga sp. TaxID=1904254 RepID=UPI003D09BA67
MPSPQATPGARVLVIEDEADIRHFVRLALESEGHEVTEAATLERGLIEAGVRRPDLVVLDLGLPDGDGVDFIRAFRSWSSSPVLVLSARSTENDKVRALDVGADDYLVKPFGSAELLARTRAHLRRRNRHAGADEALLSFGNIAIDRARRRVTRDGEQVHLTPIEYGLLLRLTSHPDRVITHRQLLQELWGPVHADNAHYVRVHMGNLRKKIEADPSRPRWLLTETGVGYRFSPEGPVHT